MISMRWKIRIIRFGPGYSVAETARSHCHHGRIRDTKQASFRNGNSPATSVSQRNCTLSTLEALPHGTMDVDLGRN